VRRKKNSTSDEQDGQTTQTSFTHLSRRASPLTVCDGIVPVYATKKTSHERWHRCVRLKTKVRINNFRKAK